MPLSVIATPLHCRPDGGFDVESPGSSAAPIYQLDLAVAGYDDRHGDAIP